MIKYTEFVFEATESGKWFDAIRSRKYNTIKDYISKGWDVNIITPQTREAALFVAVRYMTNPAYLNNPPNTHKAVLWNDERITSLKIVNELLNANADVNYQNCDRNETALSQAALNADLELVKLLMGHDADPNLGDDGVKPLQLSFMYINASKTQAIRKEVLSERCEIVKYLLEHGAEPENLHFKSFMSLINKSELEPLTEPLLYWLANDCSNPKMNKLAKIFLANSKATRFDL